MIISTRSTPIRIQKEEALLRRLHPSHNKRSKIIISLKKGWAGFRGEQNLDYYLGFLPKKNYFIIPDLRLQLEDHYFQIDCLLLSPSFLLIIESKNLFGTLFFDEYPKQVIRTYQGQEEGFPHPLAQAKRQKESLTLWLKSHKIQPCPIEYLVAIGSSSTILKTNPGKQNIYDKIMHAEHIPRKIIELQANYNETHLSPYRLQKLVELFQFHHHPLQIDILKKYEVCPSEILKGVICPSCHQPKMVRVHANWYCGDCNRGVKDAHIQAIYDYLHLFNSISNKECRTFLGLSSINVCTRLLREMKLASTGSVKNKIYFLP